MNDISSAMEHKSGYRCLRLRTVGLIAILACFVVLILGIGLGVEKRMWVVNAGTSDAFKKISNKVLMQLNIQRSPRNDTPGSVVSEDGITNKPSKGVPKPNCSPAVFRQHFVTHDYFPYAGNWTSDNHYIPDLCNFTIEAPLKQSLPRCLKALNVTSIAMLGASQGKRYFGSLANYIGKAFPKRKVIKSENQVDRMPDKKYYADNRNDVLKRLSVDRRGCSGCTAQKLVASSANGNQSVTLEYLGMDHVLDSTVRLASSGFGPRNKSMELYQEFMFCYYFFRSPPDIIIINPVLNHAKFRQAPSGYALDITHLKGLIQNCMPNSTRIIWVPGMSEHEEAKARSPRYKQLKVEGMLATDLIIRLNRVLFDTLKEDLVDPDTGSMAFMDLVPMSQSCPKSWWSRSDGVHMAPTWYARIMEYMVNFLCAVGPN